MLVEWSHKSHEHSDLLDSFHLPQLEHQFEKAGELELDDAEEWVVEILELLVKFSRAHSYSLLEVLQDRGYIQTQKSREVFHLDVLLQLKMRLALLQESIEIRHTRMRQRESQDILHKALALARVAEL